MIADQKIVAAWLALIGGAALLLYFVRKSILSNGGAIADAIIVPIATPLFDWMYDDSQAISGLSADAAEALANEIRLMRAKWNGGEITTAEFEAYKKRVEANARARMVGA